MGFIYCCLIPSFILCLRGFPKDFFLLVPFWAGKQQITGSCPCCLTPRFPTTQYCIFPFVVAVCIPFLHSPIPFQKLGQHHHQYRQRYHQP
ncbi:hypothetical protein HD806DRAFT_41755 [Xylariaceae sp. AK1471]|nr:hypothetical protein HD806DRAFT_41755 [Xylariaceae sp. AK1471]